ncbi:hypothetical protein ABIC71_003725 [Herbaspirillum seropedicae]|uniref:hypothetical protein n=1 Tax=Herbaspirillum seropedicae TaxID=964 RepID=UPI003394E9CD
MADLTIKLPEVDLGRVDTIITVQNPGGGRIGEIHLSKGTIEWWAAGTSVNGKSLSWDAFAKFFAQHGDDIKVVSKKKRSVAANAPAKATKKPSIKATAAKKNLTAPKKK